MQPRTKHVSIVKAVYACILRDVFHGLDAFYHARSARLASPPVAHIRTYAPATTARFCAPKPRLSVAPLADVERNGTCNGFESIAQTAVTHNGCVLFGGCIAVVALHNIHVPLGILLGIYPLIAIRAKRTCTCFVGRIGVKSKLHALAVHVISNRSQAVRKAFGVG